MNYFMNKLAKWFERQWKGCNHPERQTVGRNGEKSFCPVCAEERKINEAHLNLRLENRKIFVSLNGQKLHLISVFVAAMKNNPELAEIIMDASNVYMFSQFEDEVVKNTAVRSQKGKTN